MYTPFFQTATEERTHLLTHRLLSRINPKAVRFRLPNFEVLPILWLWLVERYEETPGRINLAFDYQLAPNDTRVLLDEVHFEDDNRVFETLVIFSFFEHQFFRTFLVHRQMLQ